MSSEIYSSFVIKSYLKASNWILVFIYTLIASFPLFAIFIHHRAFESTPIQLFFIFLPYLILAAGVLWMNVVYPEIWQWVVICCLIVISSIIQSFLTPFVLFGYPVLIVNTGIYSIFFQKVNHAGGVSEVKLRGFEPYAIAMNQKLMGFPLICLFLLTLFLL